MRDITDVIVRPLAISDEAEAHAAHHSLAADSFEFLQDRVDGEAWADYVARVAAIERGEQLAPGRVPAAFRVAEIDGRIAGRVSVRFELTDYLADVGGHIGYGVVPRFRRRGVACALLRHGLDALAHRGVDHALVTCDDDNIASRGVIEKLGGHPDHGRPRAVRDGEAKLRFWVPTSHEASAAS
ncbi:GNAT family N-acetyltransferase [Microbacterium sp. MPKO10]|uniref:GNAT family N-acetyltransferase n=1 Tax=Microbacterium sp. MPKO10 TaxID=2989818 RepID=UPI0022357A91|nr:GNAT family N-acetyltransferase [Microbacterium sp. MPKO10]MCW4458048.1 GNAT family N-acetyltransferase [Microbacterium sp. MPKO10]